MILRTWLNDLPRDLPDANIKGLNAMQRVGIV